MPGTIAATVAVEAQMSEFDPASEPSTAPLPVTVVVSREAIPGREHELLEWAEGIREAAAAFPGHLGAQIYPATPPANYDVIVAFSFATADELSVWEHSAVRQEWIDRAKPLVTGRQRPVPLSGFESIFAPSIQAAKTPPPRWKTASIIALALFPMSLLLNIVLGPVISHWNVVARVALTTVLIVPWMTWLGVPWLTKWLQGWLHPKRD